MNQELKMFEEATKDTLERWRNTPEQRSHAEENVKYGIIYALNDNFYNGFTSRNMARGKAIELGKDGMEFALIYNMIQLSDYKHQTGESLGWMDNYIVSIASYCNQGKFEDLEEIFHIGLQEMSQEQQLLQSYRIIDPKEMQIQRDRLKEARERNNPKNQIAYNYADSIVSGYVWYNTTYNVVSSDKPIKTFYDQHSADDVVSYYESKKQIAQNIQR